MPDLSKTDVIAPNFKRRISGVTATIIRLVPIQANDIGIVSSGTTLPPEVPKVSIWQLMFMSRRGPSGARVWHARRNTEMLAGLILKSVFRKQLKLLFTSASQRNHSGYTKWLISKMDAIIATSSRSEAYLKRPATVIRHGIDTRSFVPIADKSKLRTDLGLPDSGPLIGCFGRIRHQKGTDVFVNAMISVLRDHPSANAIVVGGVTDKHTAFVDDLKARIDAAGLSNRLQILPEAPVWDIGRYFQALDIYVAPQRWEGFGLTPLEAMSCGVPVIATRVGAFEELILDGKTGALVDIADTKRIADITSELLEDPTKLAAWSAAAREHMVAEFDIAGEAAAITSVYRQLLSDQSSR